MNKYLFPLYLFTHLSLFIALSISCIICSPPSDNSNSMNKPNKNIDIILDKMVSDSLKSISDKSTSIYTFAFYHDHESDAISICIDTEDNSEKEVISSNKYTQKYFKDILKNNDIDSLKLWNINTGRNFSLGNFTFVNVVYVKLEKIYFTKSLYLSMINCIERNKKNILAHSKYPQKVVFCCSSEKNEVEYIWQ